MNAQLAYPAKPRIKRCRIEGYRSIREQIELEFPSDAPLVLIGENNAGKSNIVSAIDLVLGEAWPGSKEPEDHDFWGRNSDRGCIKIEIEVSGMYHMTSSSGSKPQVEALRWIARPGADEPVQFCAVLPGGQTKYVPRETKEQLIAVTVNAERRLTYELSYASKWTLLSRLMRKFHAALRRDEARRERLQAMFEELKRIFREVDEFAEFETNMVKQFDEMLEGMSYALRIDFAAYDPSRFFHSLRVVPMEGSEVRSFDELGTGQQQILALGFAQAYAKAFYDQGIVLIIEEPEAHLHPLAQRWLARQVRRMCEDGLQVILTTHSPAFIDVMALEGLVYVCKRDGATCIRQLTRYQLADYCHKHGAHLSKTRADTVLPFYAAHATEEILAGFFARAVVLVEGQTESLALPVYLERAGLDVVREGIAIIPVMGKGNLAKWWRLFTAYNIPVYVIFDNDSKDDSQAQHRKDLLATLQVPDPSDLEMVLTTDELIIRHSFAVFGQNFEKCAARIFGPDYNKIEADAQAQFGNSKPIVARYIADNLPMNNPGWERIRKLAERLRNLVQGPTGGQPGSAELDAEQPELSDDDLPF